MLRWVLVLPVRVQADKMHFERSMDLGFEAGMCMYLFLHTKLTTSKACWFSALPV